MARVRGMRFLTPVCIGVGTFVIGGSTGSAGRFSRPLLAATVPGLTTLVSVNRAGNASGGGTSDSAAVTPDGRYVVFTSDASDLVANDTNGLSDVFVRDLTTATTNLVSVNSAGAASGNGASGPVDIFGSLAISPNGRYVVFTSGATDLTANDTAGGVFVRDLTAGTTTLVSVNGSGSASGNGASDSGAITPDGRYVVFTSAATDLTANDTVGGLFVRDLRNGTTKLVSVNRMGLGGGATFPAAICSDGRYVVFDSGASDLVANDTNFNSDVFVRDVGTSYCGDWVVDPGEECDDGNTVGGDGCSPTCQIEPNNLTSGGNTVRDACVHMWLTAPVAAMRHSSRRANRIACTEGDPSCDFGPAEDGVCTFHVAQCLNVTNSGFPCTAADISEARFSEPSARPSNAINAHNRAALDHALVLIGGSVNGFCVNRGQRRVSCTQSSECDTSVGRGDGWCASSLAFEPALARANACTPFVQVAVPIRQMGKLRLSTRGSRYHSEDFLTLICRPHA